MSHLVLAVARCRVRCMLGDVAHLTCRSFWRLVIWPDACSQWFYCRLDSCCKHSSRALSSSSGASGSLSFFFTASVRRLMSERRESRRSRTCIDRVLQLVISACAQKRLQRPAANSDTCETARLCPMLGDSVLRESNEASSVTLALLAASWLAARHMRASSFA